MRFYDLQSLLLYRSIRLAHRRGNFGYIGATLLAMTAAQGAATLGIADVERATGISKETLRAWERRYGFPAPQRSASGDRRYAHEDIGKLRLIRQLLARGVRPNHVVSKSLAELRALANSVDAPSEQSDLGFPLLAELHQLLRRQESGSAQDRLDHLLAERGLKQFVLHVARPLAHAIGDAWEAGSLRLFEQRIITEQLERVLWMAIRSIPGARARPSVLLATIQPERHVLGLLMAHALLALRGERCLWLGAAAPLDEIAAAALAQGVRTIGVSFSGHSMRPQMIADMTRLRDAVPAEIAIWAGGSGVARLERGIVGVVAMTSLEDLLSTLDRGRAGVPV